MRKPSERAAGERAEVRVVLEHERGAERDDEDDDAEPDEHRESRRGVGVRHALATAHDDGLSGAMALEAADLAVVIPACDGEAGADREDAAHAHHEQHLHRADERALPGALLEGKELFDVGVLGGAR